jgi:hypothetical protein
MIVRAQAKNVSYNIGAVVGCPKRSNMRCFGVRAAFTVKTNTTHLTVKVM